MSKVAETPKKENLIYIRSTGDWLDGHTGIVYKSVDLVDNGISVFELMAIISKPNLENRGNNGKEVR